MSFESEIETSGLGRTVDAVAAAMETSPSFQQWRAAIEAFKRDAALARLLERYQNLAGGWQQRGHDGVELAEVADQIQNHPLYQERERATAAVAALFRLVNARLSQKLGVDFAANAAPPKRSCCG